MAEDRRPTPLSRRLRAWLELMRISNLPTVWSNVLVGCAAGAAGAAISWPAAAVAAAGASLIYVAGMASNDLLDAEVDRRERPGRPVPSGRIRPGAGWFFAAFAALLSCAGLLWWSPRAGGLALGLTGLVAGYNALHRFGAVTVLLLGGCRALVYLLAAAVQVGAGPLPWGAVAPWACAGGAYVVLLSLVARREAAHGRRVPVVLWLLRGIALLDAAFLLALGQPAAAAIAVGCFLLTWLWHRFIMGT